VTDQTIYFGAPGKLIKLYDPVGGMLATREIPVSVFQTGTGGARTSRLLNGTRQYALNYGVLGRKNFEYMNAFQQGHMGPGPFVLLDPGRRNLLTVNQSSGTSGANDTRDFTVSGAGGSISSDNSQSTAFPRTLKWSFATTTPAAASLLLDKPSTVWPGIPVINRPYTFACLALAGVGSVTVAPTIRWMDLAGATLSTSTGTAVAVATTAWSELLVTATPPAGGAWAQCGLAPTLATIAAGESLWFSALAFAEGDQPDPVWSPGTGVYPVQVMALPEVYGFAEPSMLVQPVLTLQEVR
jgi:hypothetical protein